MDQNNKAHDYPGGVRRMTARWVVTGNLTLTSAANFGGQDDSAVDMAVLRDPKDGGPLLPGTTLAGALRSYLADRLGGYGSQENERVERLFGFCRIEGKGSQRVDTGDQSPFIIFDSLGNLPDGKVVEIRDGVAIEPKSGIAAPGKKFDMEVIPAGTIFPVHFELIIADQENEDCLLADLATALDGLSNGDIPIGARRTRGLGAAKASDWNAARYDLTADKGWLDWILSEVDTGALLKTGDRFETSRNAIAAAKPDFQLLEIPDRRRRLLIDAMLSCSSGLLVRSPATEANAPDAVHLTSGGQSILPGTSLAGVLRNRAMKIAHLVRKNRGDGVTWVNRIFGPPPVDENDLIASRLRVSESAIVDGTRMRPTRIRIDRFTQGVHKGALFDEEPEYNGKAQVRMELRLENENPKDDDAMCGLLLLLLKDLLSDDIHVGGASAVGRGRVSGTAAVCLPDGKTVNIGPNLAISDEDKALFNTMIKAFHQADPHDATTKEASND
jgi:CRISPR/Cas system CMR subunit Cmr4 (Cas7 group RAMP superfamily)